jgi:hypothetical protein
MRIDIIHMRDPDCACDHEVYVDGNRAGYHDIRLHFYEFDPGAGYDMDEFEDNKRAAVENAPDFLKARIAQIYDEMKTTYGRWSL